MCLVPVFADLFGRAAVQAVTAHLPRDLWLVRPASAPRVATPAAVPIT
jgi:hypothetical protein